MAAGPRRGRQDGRADGVTTPIRPATLPAFSAPAPSAPSAPAGCGPQRRGVEESVSAGRDRRPEPDGPAAAPTARTQHAGR